MKPSRSGFTIVEVLIAIIVLAIGVLALASSAGGTTRMMMSGQRKTRSVSVATSTLDSLRQKAYSASPKCSGLVGGSSSSSAYGTMISRAWTVTGTGTDRNIVITTSYRLGPVLKGDTLVATIYPPCP